MAKIPNKFSKIGSPFKVLEDLDLDLNYQTPTSSIRVQKKLIFNSGSSEKHDKRVAFRRERFVINKHPLQLTTLCVKTPPMNKSLSFEPLAPMKPRKSINKMDLKPKKLIFKDVEEPEVEIVQYPSTIYIKPDDNIVNVKYKSKAKIHRKKPTASDEKENQRGLLLPQIDNIKSNNNKVNLLKPGGINNNVGNTALSNQSRNLRIKSGLKHFRL